jgi:anti-anti-sigma factor
MALDIIQAEDTVIVALIQRFDTASASEVETQLKTLLTQKPKKMIFDFSRTDYIASSGLRVMLSISRELMNAGCRIAMVSLRPEVLKVFTMAGFTKIFTIYASKEEALTKWLAD